MNQTNRCFYCFEKHWDCECEEISSDPSSKVAALGFKNLPNILTCAILIFT